MKIIACISLLFITLVSCEQILEERRYQNAQENYTSPYMGKWIGNYSGEGNGTLVLNVKKSGSIEVIRTDSQNQQESYFTNVFEGGSLYGNSSLNSGFTLYGNMEQKSGTWKMGDWKGTWSVTKQ